MEGLHGHERKSLGVFDPEPPRRKRNRYRFRRLGVLSLLLLLIVGLYYGASKVVDRLATWSGTPQDVAQTPVIPVVASDPLPFKAERMILAGDLDRDNHPEQIAVGPVENSLRQVAVVTGTGRSMKMVGQPITVPDFPLDLVDLPRAKSILVLSALLPSEGAPRTITVGNESALEAAGSEPDIKAWMLDPVNGLVVVNYYQLAAPLHPSAPTMMLVDKYLNVLWHYDAGVLIGTYRVTTGKHIQGPAPTAHNQQVNLVTPIGRFPIATRVPGMPYYRDNIPAGDPNNPLGTRWMGFSVYSGDNAAIWAIHGTNRPDEIGRWASDGCIRLTNADVERLYETVQVGTMLEIVSSRK